MRKGRIVVGSLILLSIAILLVAITLISRRPIKDEAMRAGRAAATLEAAADDYFRGMDGGIALTAAEVRGRNTWNVWTAGNDRFWDLIAVRSGGTLDFLKTLSSHPSLKFSRDNRFAYLGLINEPCFEKAKGPNADRFGLWLDTRNPDCAPDPFEDEAQYPGVKIGARGVTVPVGSYYGYATGVLGLRLFPNPEFDEKAKRRWDPVRYYTDPAYYQSKDLVKPYRVGMSCGFCHIGPDPLNPPVDPESPRWENLSSSVGAQYFWVDRIFSWEADPASFMYQIFHSSRPGALDTSLVSTDYINNPRTMNAVYNLGARIDAARLLGEEKLAAGSLDNRQFNDFLEDGPLTTLFRRPDTVLTPHVLKDGADSVGALGALNRVFINIGLFSEEWLEHFNPLVGGRRVSPIEIQKARRNSGYWQATEAQTVDLAQFFLRAATPHRLKDAPGGAAKLETNADTLRTGKIVFADTCARCHSSKLPQSDVVARLGRCAGPDYLKCWDAYWAETKTDSFKEEMRRIVLADDFLENNFLSTDMRVPVTLLQTNACSPVASNGIRGSIWDNFTSESYKTLPSPGEITVHHPYTGEPSAFRIPDGGRGYTRPASLVSVWSTAPLLLNNSLGVFTGDPSVEGRLRAFDDAIEKLLWPERRERDSLLPDKLPGFVERTTADSYLRMPTGFLPRLLRPLVEPASSWLPWAVTEDGISIGPIPQGTPVNLITNLQLVDPATQDRDVRGLLDVLKRAKEALKSLPPGADGKTAAAAFHRTGVVDEMLKLSACPDFVVNKGHYFGTGRVHGETALSDAEKRALIAFLKTF